MAVRALMLDGVREMMTSWCHEDEETTNRIIVSGSRRNPSYDWVLACPKCGHQIELHDQGRNIHGLPGLPAGVKFDPTDQEILEHLEAKIIMEDMIKPHPLIDEFIPTLEGDDGICYTHPEKLPGVSKDGQVRHFFHRPSKAYTTGTRKRRKVHSGPDSRIETRWHKTGKTRPILGSGQIKGFKKILVLYTNYGRQKKPEKTNWVMHQYHLGSNEEEKDGELVASKVFFQTQPRQCGGPSNNNNNNKKVVPVDDTMLFGDDNIVYSHDQSLVNGNGKRLFMEYNYDGSIINPNHYLYYGDDNDDRELISQCLPQLIPSFAIHSAEETHDGLVGIN